MASDLTWQDKKDALRLLLMITEKRNGDIKARQVADGSKQRTYDRYNKSDGSSPTVMTDSVIITGVIGAKEGRAVTVVDVNTVFLHADNNKRVLMLLRGKLAEMMVRIDS